MKGNDSFSGVARVDLSVAYTEVYPFAAHLLRGVHTVVHEAILPRTFVRVRPSQPRTRTKVRVRVRVRRPPTMLDFLYVVHVYDVQMFKLAVFR